MDPVMIGWLIIGGIGGFYIGRRYAEDSRAEHDMKRTWEGRKAYREKKK